MALFTGSSLIVPKSISATSRMGLERKIQLLNAKDGMEYKFINFYFDSKSNEHVGWYYTQINESELILTENKNAKTTK